jgi:hypothetical protein
MVVSVRASVLSCEKRVCCHRLAVYHKTDQMQRFGRLLIAGKQMRHPVGQMHITAMRGGPQWMSLFVMQQCQGTTARYFA